MKKDISLKNRKDQRMKKIFILSISLLILPVLVGCETINSGIDKTKGPGKALGKTGGKVLDATGSVAEGMVDGISEPYDEDNPFNR